MSDPINGAAAPDTATQEAPTIEPRGGVQFDDVFGTITPPAAAAPEAEAVAPEDAEQVEPVAEESPAKPEADATEEAAPEDEPAEEAPVLASDAIAAIRTAVPGIEIGDTPEAAAEAVRGLYDSLTQTQQGLDTIAKAAQAHPGIIDFNRLLAAEKPFFTAFIEAFKEYEDALDPDMVDDVATAMKERALREQIRAEIEGPVKAAEKAVIDKWQSDAASNWTTFEPNAPEGFAEWYRSQMNPTATGRFRGDHFPSMARAYTYDADIKAARAEAETRGYERALAEAKAKGYDLTAAPKQTSAGRRTDGLPIGGSGGRAPAPPATPNDVAFRRGMDFDTLYG